MYILLVCWKELFSFFNIVTRSERMKTLEKLCFDKSTDQTLNEDQENQINLTPPSKKVRIFFLCSMIVVFFDKLNKIE